MRTLILLALAAACVSAPTTSSTRPNSNVVTSEELAKTPEPVLYDAIQRVRPAMLRASRGGQSVVVYVNDAMQGGLDVLRTIPTSGVQSVVYRSALADHRNVASISVELVKR